MTGPTVTYRTSFRRKPESRLTAPPAAACAPLPQPEAMATAVPAATSIARLLALAHHVERLVEAGDLKDYADAARQLGMAKSHMTHVTNLLSLAPDIQAAILDGGLATTEHALRGSCRVLLWSEQHRILQRAMKASRRFP